MRYYLKALRSYFTVIFFPDEDNLRDPYTEGAIDPNKKNAFRRYTYYSIDELAIVNPATGCYEIYPMPRPFHIPGRIYWYAKHVWAEKSFKLDP